MRKSSDAECPSGIWRIVWDRLPYKMCDSFYNTFHANGKYSTPGTRIRDKVWLNLVIDYKKSLNDPNKQDSMKIFPTTFRRDGKRNFVKCNSCNEEHPSFYFLHKVKVQNEIIDIWDRGYRVCLPCARGKSNNPTAFFICECCGRKFYYTKRTEIIHEIGKSNFDWKKQRWCRQCKKRTTKCSHCGKSVPIYQMREFKDNLRNTKSTVCGDCFKELIDRSKREREALNNEIIEWRICRDCRRSFSITNGEAEYFNKKGLNWPTRCPNCRGRRY